MKIAFRVATILLVLSLSAPAFADEFDEIVGQGQRYYGEENYDKAIEKFFEAKLINDAPELVYNIARAYHKKGTCKSAKKYYEQFLARQDEAEKATVAKAMKHVEDLGECPTTGVIALTCNPPTAAVQLNGEDKGACGKLELDEGSYTLVFTADGFNPADETVDVVAGETTSTVVSLEPSATIVPVEEPSSVNWLGLSLVIGGVAFVGGAVIIDVVNATNLEELDKLPIGDPARTSFEDALALNQTLIWAFGGVGIAAALTGGILWIAGVGSGETDTDETAGDLRWDLSPHISPDGSVAATMRVEF